MLRRNLFCNFIVMLIALVIFCNDAYAQKTAADARLSVRALAITTVSGQKTEHTSYRRKIGERSLSMESLPITVISGQEIQNTGYSNKDFREIIQSVPGTNVDISRESTINLRGLGTARTLVLIDGKRMEPVYAQSVITDLNNIPQSAIERIEVLKDGASAIYGSDAVSGVVNFITKQEIEPRINANNVYDPYYTIPKFDYSGLQNNEYNSWVNNVKNVFSENPGITINPDLTYGRGGKLQVDLKVEGDFRVQDLKFLDNSGNVRQWTHYEIYPENYRYGETYYYDCGGSTLHYSSGFTDINGFNFSLLEKAYQNNQPAVEYRDIWPVSNGNTLRLNLNPQQTSGDVFKGFWNNYNFDASSVRCKSNGVNACHPNILYGGFSLVFEDFGKGVDRLKMPGGFINYTRMFSENFGATAHVSYNSGQRGMVDYSKLNLLAGISYTPFSTANCNDKFIFTTQALLGMVRQGQKYNTVKYNDTYFTGMFGFTEAIKVSDNVAVRVSEHYTPTFANGNTANNFTFGLGVRFDF